MNKIKIYNLLIEIIILGKLIKSNEINLAHEYKKMLLSKYSNEIIETKGNVDDNIFEVFESVEMEDDENLYIDIKEWTERVAKIYDFDLKRII